MESGCRGPRQIFTTPPPIFSTTLSSPVLSGRIFRSNDGDKLKIGRAGAVFTRLKLCFGAGGEDGRRRKWRVGAGKKGCLARNLGLVFLVFGR